MKVAFITPGFGGSFYCQNCFRDDELLTTLLLRGHDVRKVPMYLPAGVDEERERVDSPVFYGAINVYLREKLPLYRRAPNWMEKIFDSKPMLNYAAKKSGSTRASGLEEMTLSMLRGEEGRQVSELNHLVDFLRDEVRPSVVHLSNALLLGLARQIKEKIGARVVCSLQDEHEWIDPMAPSYQEAVWNLMAERAEDVDLFITASQYYSSKSQDTLRLPAEKIKVIRGGINLKGYEPSPLPFDPPVIGYLCRMAEYFGLDILVDAFLRLKRDSRFRDIKLYITGGYSGDDKPFIREILKKIETCQCEGDIRIFEDFSKRGRIEFLKSLTLLSVPVPSGEAFGAYQVEALAARVPIVQPNIGCYPEFIEETQGGVIYEPNDAEHLADAIAAMLENPEEVRKLGRQGRDVILKDYSIDGMADAIAAAYEEVAIRD